MNSKPKLLMYMGGNFFSGHYNREGQFVDTHPVKLYVGNPPQYIGHATTVCVAMDRREVFDLDLRRKTVGHIYSVDLYFTVEYDGAQPFVTIPTINGPIKHLVGGPVLSKEEFDKTTAGIQAAIRKLEFEESQQIRDFWNLLTKNVDKAANIMFTEHPKRTRRFASGVESYTAGEIFDYLNKAIGQHSYRADLISQQRMAILLKWAREKCQFLLIEKAKRAK